MNPFLIIYNEILWRPLFNGLVFFYNTLPGSDLGLSIIALTITIRTLLIPLMYKAQKAQRDLAIIQPKIKQLQEKHKDDREAQGKALMALYAEHKVNPFSGCLVTLIQLPVLIALFQVFRNGFDVSLLSYLYHFVNNPGALNPISFGVLNLSKGNIYLGIIASLTQYFQIKLTMPPDASSPRAGDFSHAMRIQSMYVFPLLILLWSYSLPSALTLYWTVVNIFGIVQEVIVKKKRAG